MATEQIDTSRTVAIGCYIGVGTRDEPADRVGVSHFLEHLVFKGTRQRSAREIAELIDATGGDMNAYTTKEYTAFYVRVPARDLDTAIELLGDVVGAPAFDRDEFESERHVILEELHLAQDEPDDYVHSLLYEALYGEHPLGWEIVGHEESIAAMTPQAARRFHRRWYTPANMVWAVAGPVEHAAVGRAISRRIKAVPGSLPRRRPPRSLPAQERIARRKTETAHLAFGWPAVDHFDGQRFAMGLVNQILGGGLSSRLFQTIREERGLAYSVFSSVASYCDAGVATIYAGTTPDAVATVVSAVRGIVDDVVRNGVSPRELDVAKSAFEGSVVMGLDDTSSRMARLGTSLTLRGELTPIDSYLRAIRAVSLDDANALAARVFTAPPVLAAVGPVTRRDVRPPGLQR